MVVAGAVVAVGRVVAMPPPVFWEAVFLQLHPSWWTTPNTPHSFLRKHWICARAIQSLIVAWCILLVVVVVVGRKALQCSWLAWLRVVEVMWLLFGEKKKQKEAWKWEKEKGIQCDDKEGLFERRKEEGKTKGGEQETKAKRGPRGRRKKGWTTDVMTMPMIGTVKQTQSTYGSERVGWPGEVTMV